MSILVWIRSLLISALVLSGWLLLALGQEAANRIVQAVDESRVVTLAGNTHPMARSEFDEGPVSAELQLNHLVLHLAPSAAQQAALDALVAEQHDPKSPLYHHWLTPAQYGARFGVSAQDLSRVATWLSGHGFQIDDIPASNRLIVFSGTAGQVSDAFHTEMHRYRVNGVDHLANSQDPQIPEALARVVSGVVSLHDFRRNAENTARRAIGAQESAQSKPLYSSGGANYLYPADWATIYDLNSLYNAGTTGTGTSIAIVGRSNINVSDVTQFRQAAGLPANNPTVILVSGNPGLVSGDQDESTLDVEWSGGVAPGATVKFVVGTSTQTTDGVDLSAQYIVNHASALVVSTSYGSCEQDMGTTELVFYNSLWQQAASQGMSAFVSSGDSGAVGCYWGGDSSASGAGVNGLCSSPYSTCVGGTEFHEGANNATYWGTTNPSTQESALSYIPEVVWNESGSNGGSGLWASTGGVSLVYQQPSWQVGVPGTAAANGMRAVPDVAMAAAGHDGYIIVEDGSSWVISGTSAASPSFAGVMALLVQAKGGTGQGNANAGLYPLLNAAQNPFHATPSGNNSVPGVTGFSATGAEYNLATGLGSVDGALLVGNWGTGSPTTTTDFVLKAGASSGTVLTGKTTAFNVSVTESGGGRNAVALTVHAPAGITAVVSPTSIAPGATATVTITVAANATVGTQNVIVSGSDSSGTQTATYVLTVTQTPTLALAASANTLTLLQGAQGTIGLTATPGGSFSGSISLLATGLPAGVTAGWSTNPISTGAAKGTSTVTLTASASATVGTATVTISATGDGLVATQTVSLQVQQAPSVMLGVSPTSVSVLSLATTTVTVTATPLGGAMIPAGAIGSTISVTSGLPTGFAAGWSAPSVNASGAIVWTLTLTGSSAAVAGTSTLALMAHVTAKSGAVYNVSQSLSVKVTLSPPSLAVQTVSEALTAVQGASTTDVVNVIGNGTFSGTVAMSLSALPAGVTAAWSRNPVTLASGSGSSLLTLTASPTATAGSYTIKVSATGDGLVASENVTLQVQLAPGVTLTALPTSVSVLSLASASVIVTATPAGGALIPTGAAGSIISVASGLPAGFTAGWSAPVVAASGAAAWTLTLTGSPAAAASASTLVLTAKVVAKSGTVYTVSQSLPVNVTLSPPTLAVAPASSALSATTLPMSGTATVTDAFALTANATFSGAVTMSVTGLPAGVTASWSSNPVTLTAHTGSSMLTFTAASTAVGGSYTPTITAQGDGIIVNQSLKLTIIVPPPTLTVSPAAASMTVVNPVEAISASEGIAQQLITFTGGGSYRGPVSLSVSGLPSYVTASWSSDPVTLNGSNVGTSMLTISVGKATMAGSVATVAPGTYSFSVTATGDGLTVVKTIQLQTEGILVTPSLSSITIHRGTSGVLAVTTTPVGGAVGSVQLSLSENVPLSGVTVQASPASIASPGSGITRYTFAASSMATLRSYQVNIAATMLTSSNAPLLNGSPMGAVTLNIVP
jgi:hypothetical protein